MWIIKPTSAPGFPGSPLEPFFPSSPSWPCNIISNNYVMMFMPMRQVFVVLTTAWSITYWRTIIRTIRTPFSLKTNKQTNKVLILTTLKRKIIHIWWTVRSVYIRKWTTEIKVQIKGEMVKKRSKVELTSMPSMPEKPGEPGGPLGPTGPL